MTGWLPFSGAVEAIGGRVFEDWRALGADWDSTVRGFVPARGEWGSAAASWRFGSLPCSIGGQAVPGGVAPNEEELEVLVRVWDVVRRLRSFTLNPGGLRHQSRFGEPEDTTSGMLELHSFENWHFALVWSAIESSAVEVLAFGVVELWIAPWVIDACVPLVAAPAQPTTPASGESWGDLFCGPGVTPTQTIERAATYALENGTATPLRALSFLHERFAADIQQVHGPDSFEARHSTVEFTTATGATDSRTWSAWERIVRRARGGA